MKIFPPVRREDDRRAVLAGRRGWDGRLDRERPCTTLGPRARGPFASQPAGAITLETMVAVLLDRVTAGELSLPRLVRALAGRTAEVYGVGPRKGKIAPGSDADVTVVDLGARWEIDAARLHSKARMSAWHGRRVTGRAVMTIVRGRVVMRDGEPISAGPGRFVRPA
jgi:allantoinase